MGTSAFDRLWDAPGTDSVDALWGEESPPAKRTLKRLPVQADATARRAPGTGTSGDFEVLGSALAANLANAAQGIPGMEAVQAGARSLVRGQPYREALSDIRTATEGIPAPLRIAGRLAGGAPLAGVLPAVSSIKGAAALGAGLGAADAGLAADPDLSLAERAGGAAIGAGLGAAVGGGVAGLAKGVNKGRELLRTRQLIKDAPTLGEQAVTSRNALSAMDDANYGQAAAEGAGKEATTVVKAAFDDPDIAPFVQRIRNARSYAGADDATVGREAYKLMSKQAVGYERKLAQEYDADIDLKRKDLRSAMRTLKSALGSRGEKPPITLDIAGENTIATGPHSVPGEPNIFGLPTHAEIPGVEISTSPMRVQTAPAEAEEAMMPSFPEAVQSSAVKRGLRTASAEAADDAKRIMSGTSLAGKKQDRQSLEAVVQKIQQTDDPETLRQMLLAYLGRGKEALKVNIPAQTGLVGGVRQLAQPAMKLDRLAPLIREAQTKLGMSTTPQMDVETLLKLLGVGNAAVANPEY